MDTEVNYWLVYGGLVLGAAFGFLAQRSRFCVVAAVSNYVLIRDKRQLDAYLAAVAVAVAGVALLELGGWVDMSQSAYLRPSLDWVGAFGGGVVFGIGAMMAGGCASRTLVRTAEGNIGAIITLISFTLAGMVALFGVLEPVRSWLFVSASIRLESDTAALAGLLMAPKGLVSLLVIGVCLLLIALHAKQQANLRPVVYGALIGLTVALGWWVTGKLAQDEFLETPPTSLSVSGPLARGGVYLTMGHLTGSQFALLLVPGMLLGAWISALMSRSFHWIAPASERIGTSIGGGALMGVGAIFAGGCNVGQGLSGISTLSVYSLIAVIGTVMGMLLSLWVMERKA